MEENLNDKILVKKEWNLPQIFGISIKNTGSGNNPSPSEDTPYIQPTLS